MPADLSCCTELVIVCGHATFIGSSADIQSEDKWLLQHFQRSDPGSGKPGEHETFVAHILSGAFAVAGRPNALLVFSGGRTANADRTEAEGYEQVYFGLGDPFSLGHRYVREDHATDSFQNLLFSILSFRQATGQYPQQVVVVTHAFKTARFLELHAPAIRWPSDRIRVQGINPPFTQDELQNTLDGEYKRAYRLFECDPYGMHSPLVEKRLARNVDFAAVEREYGDVESEVEHLLKWTGGASRKETIPEILPWESREPVSPHWH